MISAKLNRSKILTFLILVLVLEVDLICSPITLSQDSMELTKGDLDPAWSPDGENIAFQSWRTGNADIWIYNFGKETVVNLTEESILNDYNPVWSPNSENIVYVSGDDSNIDLYSIDIMTLEIVNLTNTPTIQEFAPAISTDGRYLAFVSQTMVRQDIGLLDLDTGEKIIITKDQATTIWGLPNWYLQDNLLVFTDSPLEPNTNLWLYRPNSKALEQITTNGLDTLPNWSPIERKLAMVSRRSGNLDVWLFDLKTDEYTNLTPLNDRLDTDPTWSPDGKWIAYVAYTGSDSTNSRQDVWIVNLETGKHHNLTNNISQATSPVWSPIDDRIAFISYEGFTTLWVINLDGTKAIQLTKPVNE